jgi:hypothetical protein
MRRSWLFVVIFWGLASADVAFADGPADGLLKLVPTNSGATLVVEDLRGRAREVAGSPLFEGLLRLRMVRSWMTSEPYRKAERAARDIQGALGVPLSTIRDELLGDAFVLALQAGPSGRPEQSRGLLLARPRDRALIGRLIKLVNDAQIRGGELDGVDPRTRGAVKYSARLYKAAGRPPEFYVLLDDGTFAWSNSEAMILGVIDRWASGGPSLRDDPQFRKVRGALPDRPLASLYINARFLEGALAEGPRPGGDRVAVMIGRYLHAVGQIGVALEWRDGIFLHSSETVAVEKLDPWLKDWLTRPPSTAVLPSLVSPSTVAVASASVDFRALLGAWRDLVPGDDRPNLDSLKMMLQGLFMGRDPVTEVLPRLAPGVVLAVEIEPDTSIRRHFPMIAAARWSVEPGEDDLAGPIDNAMKTLLAFYSFAPKRPTDRLRVESKAIGDARLNLLTDGLRTLLAYRVDRDRLVVGNSPEAVARFATGQPPSALTDIRTRFFPDAETFAIADVAKIAQEIRERRTPIARRLAARSKRSVESVDSDLGDLIAVAELFKAFTFTSTASKDATEVRRTIGLMAR